MKKKLSIVFIFILAVGILAGCAAKKEVGNQDVKQDTAGQVTNTNDQDNSSNQNDSQNAALSTGDKDMDNELNSIDKDLSSIDSNDKNLDSELNLSE